MLIKQEMATQAQLEYLNILFIDCGFDQKVKKATLMTDYKVNYPDELTKTQATGLIAELKQLKEDKRGK